MKHGRHRFLKACGVLLLAGAVVFGLLQTVPGKALIASALSRAFSRAPDVEVHIGRISGWIPGSVNIEEIAIADMQGEWLSARNLRCRWLVRELLKGRIRLGELGAETIELHRFPESTGSATARRRELRGVSLLELRLDGLQIDRLGLGDAVAGMPLEYAVRSGGIALEQGTLTGGVAISGDADGWVDFEASLTNPADSRLLLNAELTQMNKPTFGLDRLSGSGEATIDAGGVSAVIVARLEEKGQTGNLATRLHYAGRKLQLQQFQLTGPELSVTGDVTLGFETNRIAVALNGGCLDSRTNYYTLLGTASVTADDGTRAVVVHDLEIGGWDSVVFSVAGTLAEDRVDLKGELKPFDINRLPVGSLAGFDGRMSGRFSITGSLGDPQIAAGIELLQFRSGGEALDELPMLDFRVEGGIAQGRFSASTSLTNYNGGYLNGEIAMPAVFSLSPFLFDLETEAYSGLLDADLNLEVLNGLALMQDQHLEGALTARLSRTDRALSGFIRLEQGSYEHYGWGLVFRNVAIEVDALPDGFTIRRAEGSGAESGKVELSGDLQGGQLDVQVELTDARLVQRPEIEATISGRLACTGPVSRPLVSGRLEIDRADILPDNLVSSKPLLLTDYDARAANVAKAGTRKKKRYPVGVDVQVELSDQVYVNAALIDSVWGGTLRVQDTPAGFAVTGEVTPRRGYVTFIGKKFRLQEGDILFNGNVPSMPVFNNLTAEYARSDITARLILNGEVIDPQYRLESTPALPEDEILSHVLFNRDSSTISAYQAVQMAAAARQLSGGLSGPGFMYGFRQAVGIDTLEWREPDTTGGPSSVAAGKYITSELYVEVDSTLDGSDSTEMTAEYELNRHFSIETSAGPRLRPGIGINWKNDY